MATSDAQTIRIGQRLGSYRIEALLGAGGMGRVYLAVDTMLKRTVAIKVVGTPENAAALVREARLAAALNHPAICTVHEIGHMGNEPFIVMEHVQGVPLWAVIQSLGAVPLETALCYLLQIADAVAHAHDRGIIHGDIKSSNIMVVPGGCVKILDFGLAVRRAVAYVTSEPDTTWSRPPSAAAGTVPYMAPELLRGRLPDVQSDIWALGVVLYEMLAGCRPFRGATPYELAAHILGHQRAPLPARLPAAARAVIERCLAPAPEDRYPSAREFGAALDDLEAQWPLEKGGHWSSIQPVDSLLQAQQ